MKKWFIPIAAAVIMLVLSLAVTHCWAQTNQTRLWDIPLDPNDPKNALAYSYRGWMKYRERDYEGAIADATQSIQLNAYMGWGYDLRAWARYSKGSTGVMEDCKEAVRLLKPDSVGCLRTQGLLDFINADYKKAVSSWEKAIEKDPSQKRFLEPLIEKAKEKDGGH